jgi:hypothetical protein
MSDIQFQERKTLILNTYTNMVEHHTRGSFFAETFRFLLNSSLSIAILINMALQKILFNYFGGFLVLVVSMYGEYTQNVK